MESHVASTTVNSKQNITERLFRDTVVRGNLHLKPTNVAANLKSRSFNLPPVSHPAGKMASASKSSLISSQVTEPWSVFHSLQNETLSLTTRLGGLFPREKKISQRNDRKIVNYLRRKLHRRMNQWYNTAEYEDEDGRGNSDVFREEQPNGYKTALDKPEDIYRQYNDIGGRVSKEGDYGLGGESRSKKRSPTSSPGSSSTESGRKSPKKLQKLQLSNETESKGADKLDESGKTSVDDGGLPLIENAGNASSPTSKNIPSLISPTSDPVKLPFIKEHSNVPENVLKEEDVVDDEADEKIDDVEELVDTLQSARLTVESGTKRQRRKLAFSPIDTPYPVTNRNDTADLMHLDFSNTVDRILKGNMNIKCQTQKNIIRLYISSNLSDTETERTVLMEKVYPRLQKLCKERGHEFQVFDMNWGLRDTIMDDHSHPMLCMKELEESMEISRGPSFITLLSHKYGQCHIPHILAEEELGIITDAIRRDKEHYQTKVIMTPSSEVRPDTKGTERGGGPETPKILSRSVNRKDTANGLNVDKLMPGNKPEEAGDETALFFDDSNGKHVADQQFDNDLTLLETWYKKDENTIPAVYTLLPISSQYRDILHREKNRQQRAKGNWLAIENKLMKIFIRYSKEAGLEKLQENLNISLTEKELEKGLLRKHVEGKDTSHWLKRTINDIKSNLADNKAQEYIDLSPSKPIIDQSLNLKVEHLSTSIYKCIGAANIREYSITWNRDGVTDTNRGHANYLEKMSNDATEILMAKIDNSLECLKKSFDAKTKTSLPLYNEIVQSVKFVQERSKSFYGRKDILTRIKEYVRLESPQPLVIHGKPGNGKTSILARAAKEAASWVKLGDPIVIARFVGLTGDSTNIRLLLKGICQQLCYCFKQDPTTIPEDFHGVMNDLSGRLLKASIATPVIIFIDSLDQLSDDYKARSLMWLPRELPSHVHLIVSTLPDKKYTCFKELNKMFPNKDNFIEVPDLPENDALFILEHLFKAAHRTATLEQHDAIFNAFKLCPTPFYLKVAFDESCLWKSYFDPKEFKLASSAFKLVNAIYVRLEMNHGDALVRRALGYITAAKNGVTHNELMDLLSLDDTVLDEASAVSSLPLRRFPPVLWCRLRRDLGSYLVERSAHGVWTYRWYHKIFHDVAVDRYLENRDKAPSYHSALGEYFLGLWANRKKPFTGSENGANRLVSEQPLCYNLEASELAEPTATFYNLRKLYELPYHLINSNQFENLKLHVLLNYEWTLAKLRSVSLRSVLDDLQAALAIEPNDKELKLVSDTLQLSADVLSRDPAQFGSQLVGRLQTLVMNDKPASLGDPKKYPNLPQMLATSHRSPVLTLIPSMSCLTEPGDVLHDLLAGHTDSITAVTTTTDGYIAVTASRDNTIKVWDLRYRKVTRTIEKTGREVNTIRMCSNNTIAAACEPSRIRLWSLRRSCCVAVMDQFVDPATITVAGTDWQYLVAFYSGSNVMRTWDVDNKSGCKMLVETEIETDGVHKDHSICVSLNCNREKVLHASRGGKRAFVRNAKDGSLVFELPANGGDGACITATGISNDYYILCCRYQYMKLSEIYHLELFDNRDGKFSRYLKGCTLDSINEIYVNKLGSHIICLSSSYQTETTEFATWNIESEDHRHYARHSQMSTMGACVDLSYCLSASKQSNSLRIWNMTKRINERSEGDGNSRFGNKKKQGLEALLPMKDNPRYVIAKGANNGPLCVWNVVKGKCAGKPVHIERGLSEAQDISLAKNNKVIILCDRGMSSLSDEPSEVFQTVKIYNLKTNRFEKSKKNVFIVPSPPREYKLLGKDLIMGLNEDRDHLVIWNLITGHVVARIKTKFKEMERQQRAKQSSHAGEMEERRRKMRRNGTAQMTPWERRSETTSARTRRKEREAAEDKKKLEEFKKEKENAIEQYMISGDEKVIVCSYFAHHLCVFNVDTREHTQTLENPNSMLFLHNAAMTYTGSHLAHANFDDEAKVSYITLWDLESGEVRRRLKNESNVCCIAITNKADRVVFGNEQNTLKVWDPLNRSSLRKIRGYPGLKLGVGSKLFMINGERAVLFSGDISLWDLNRGTSLATFTPDIRIQCMEVVMDGELIIFGLSDQTNVVSLQLRGRNIKSIEVDENQGEEMFGETTGDTSDEEETEDEDGAEK